MMSVDTVTSDRGITRARMVRIQTQTFCPMLGKFFSSFDTSEVS